MAIWSKRVFPQVALHHCSISGASTIQIRQTHWHMRYEPLSPTMQIWRAVVTAAQTTESKNHHPTHTQVEISLLKKKKKDFSFHPSCRKRGIGWLNGALISPQGGLPSNIRCTYVICNKSAAKHSNRSWQIKLFWHPHFSLCASILLWQNSKPFQLEKKKKYLQTLDTAEMLPGLKFIGKASVMQKICLEETL